MARSHRVQFPDAVYHVISRGNSRQKIFRDDADMRTFLRILGEYVEKYSWLCHAYCLVCNHYHLIIETPCGNLSEGMRDVNSVYAQYFNRRHKRKGHIFDDRYKSNIVGDDSYFLELARYLACNPVRAKLTADPVGWQWSSYAATCGEALPETFLTTERILGMFSAESGEARMAYKRFVLEGLIREDMLGLQEEDTIAISRDLTGPTLRPTLSQIIDRRAGRKVREHHIYEAATAYGYSYKEISDYLGIHHTTVSRTVKRVYQLRHDN